MTASSKIDDVTAAIDWLLENDLDVTARAVAGRMGVAPSTITRNANRKNAVAKASIEQARLRAITAATKSSREMLIAKIDRRDKTISELQRKVAVLTASHRAMLMAIGEIGGVAAWQKFFTKHEEIRKELLDLYAIPDSLSGKRKLPDSGAQHPKE